MQRSKHANRIRYLGYLLLGVIAFLYWKALPDPLFSDPSSTVLLDRNGVLLGAKIAGDGQWRFPENKEVPEKFRLAITIMRIAISCSTPGSTPGPSCGRFT